MSSDPPSFQTAEDELNFILGNDVDDCDVGGDALFEELAGLTAAAAAHDGPVGADVVLADFAAGFGATSSTTQGGGPSKQPLSRKVSLSPPTRAALPALTDGAAFQDEAYSSEPLIFQDALPPLDFDLADDDMLLFPHGMSDAPPARGSGAHPFQPSMPEGGFGALFDRQESEATFGRLGLFHRPQGKPVVAPLVHAPVTPTPTKKQAPPPLVVHPPPPSYAHSQSKRPLRKRQVQFQSISPFPEPDATTLRFSLTAEEAQKAADAREARAHRRIKRAKVQAVHLMGGGDAAEVRARAAADALRATSDEEGEALLGEFARTFDAAAFVRSNLKQVYEALSAAGKAQEKKALDAASKAAVATTELALDLPLKQGHAPTIEPLRLLPAVSLEEEDAQVPTPAVVTPTASKLINTKPSATAPPPPTPKPVHPLVSINDKVLPSGKDPESRRLRRLMRNRLSAQASRDRRKKAIEEMKQTKAQKEVEIRDLQRAVDEEARRLKLWRTAVGRARERLRTRDCAKEADAFSPHEARASKKTRC